MKFKLIWMEGNSSANIGEDDVLEGENEEAVMQDVLHYALITKINLEKYQPKLIPLPE